MTDPFRSRGFRAVSHERLRCEKRFSHPGLMLQSCPTLGFYINHKVYGLPRAVLQLDTAWRCGTTGPEGGTQSKATEEQVCHRAKACFSDGPQEETDSLESVCGVKKVLWLRLTYFSSTWAIITGHMCSSTRRWFTAIKSSMITQVTIKEPSKVDRDCLCVEKNWNIEKRFRDRMLPRTKPAEGGKKKKRQLPKLLWASSRKKTQSERQRFERKLKRRLLLSKKSYARICPCCPEKLCRKAIRTFSSVGSKII